MRRKMRDVNINKNTCRTLVNQNPQAYFVSITIPQPKIRVKIPKLLMKTMQMRKNNHGGDCSDSNDSSETIHNYQSKTTKKKKKGGLRSLFSSVFGTMKPSKDEMGHQDQKLPSMFKRHSLKEYLESAKDDEHERRTDVLSFIKEKIKKRSTYSGSNVETASICSSSSSSGSSGRLLRVPPRVPTTREKTRMARSSLRKMASNKRLVGVGGGEAEMVEENGGRTDSGDKELCKKRILMGEKCKPLNYSGILQYDTEGMLLPDTFSW